MKKASFTYLKFWEGTFVKSYKIQLPVAVASCFIISCCFRSVFISAGIIFTTSRTLLNIIWKKIFVANFPLMDSANPLNGQNLKFDKSSLRSHDPYLLSWVILKPRKSFIEIKKIFGTHLSPSPVLLTKFGLSVSSVWSPGLSLIKNLTICDFQNSSRLPTFFLTLDLPRSLKLK